MFWTDSRYPEAVLSLVNSCVKCEITTGSCIAELANFCFHFSDFFLYYAMDAITSISNAVLSEI
jgi:hypothetical protein